MEAAELIGISSRTLRLAVERGEGPWIFNRDTLKTEAVTKLVARARARRGDHAIPMAQQGVLDLSMA